MSGLISLSKTEKVRHRTLHLSSSQSRILRSPPFTPSPYPSPLSLPSCLSLLPPLSSASAATEDNSSSTSFFHHTTFTSTKSKRSSTTVHAHATRRITAVTRPVICPSGHTITRLPNTSLLNTFSNCVPSSIQLHPSSTESSKPRACQVSAVLRRQEENLQNSSPHCDYSQGGTQRDNLRTVCSILSPLAGDLSGSSQNSSPSKRYQSHPRTFQTLSLQPEACTPVARPLACRRSQSARTPLRTSLGSVTRSCRPSAVRP